MPRAETKETRDTHRRLYKACTACHRAKLRCDLGSVDNPDDPPCKRCRRTGRECVFTKAYQRAGSRVASASQTPLRARSTAPPEGNGMTEQQGGIPFTSWSSNNSGQPGTVTNSPLGAAPISPSIFAPSSAVDNGHTAPTRPRAYTRTSSDGAANNLELGHGRHLETPADALQLLCAVADDNNSATGPTEVPISLEAVPEKGMWSRWMPVRDGLLTTTEAAALLSYFEQNLNPCYPIVSRELFEPRHFSQLLQEPILLGAIAVVAARYIHLGPSFDPHEPSRSRIVQAKLVAWLRERISYITMGCSTLRTIGTVEALLILSEWPPRAMLVEDRAMAGTRSQPPAKAEKHRACKMQDTISWTLIGLGVRIAQELSLEDESTYATSATTPEWEAHRRFNTWVYCLSADRHVSVRLGRASLIQAKMTTCWWENIGAISMANHHHQSGMRLVSLTWRHSRICLEHTHMVGLLQEMLYASPRLTDDLIKTGRYESVLHRLRHELDSLWDWIAGDLPGQSAMDGEPGRSQLTVDECREVMWRIDHDYVKLYANAIAMRAAQKRLSRMNFIREERMPPFQYSTMRAAEGAFLVEAVDAAIALLRYGIVLSQTGVLRSCPGRTFLRMMYASVFVMKAMHTGAIASPDDAIELQYGIIRAFRAAAVDDDHIAAELAALLERILPALPAPAVSVGEKRPVPEGVAQPYPTDPNQQDLPPPIFEFPLDDATNDLFAGWGFDPIMLLSEMEETLDMGLDTASRAVA